MMFEDLARKIKVNYGEDVLETGFASIDINVDRNQGKVDSNWRGEGDYALIATDLLMLIFIDYLSMVNGDVFYLGSLMVRYVAMTDDGNLVIVKRYHMEDDEWVGKSIESGE